LFSAIKRIIVLGGGTAGWITAGILAKKHAAGIRITLIESPDIATVGVGEGTWPTMRDTLSKLGISENTFIRRCNASFKQGSKFVNWISPENDVYYHPFTEPQGFNKVNLAPYWQDIMPADCSFAQAATFQSYLCDYGLAPKNIANKEYEAVANYGYHLDAGCLIELLREHCTQQLQVEHLQDTVAQVNVADNGDIVSLLTHNNGECAADLFVDCSGMASLLLGQTLGVPFVSCADVFFADTALAIQLPYSEEDAPIACQTIATAQNAGWIWDIGLQQRRGVGYVYASEFASEEQARLTLADYIGDATKAADARKISFSPGHRKVFWQNNCVAVGLSAGFLEPLEASALMLIETSANFIAEQLPADMTQMAIASSRFNTIMLKKWRGVIDFLKLHYALSQRCEPFWLKNRQAESIPSSLQQLLDLWRFRSPSEYDFTDTVEAFSAASYQYILYGAGFKTDFSCMPHLYRQQEAAKKHIMLNQRRLEQLKYTLPRHRELLDKVDKIGFSKI
jgi:tryptophan halogenase